MGAEIDRLEVQVEAQATKANNALDKLVQNLEKLEGSLKSINTSGLSGMSDGISKFAQASAQLSNVKTTDFNRLTKNIKSLSAINTKELYGASHAMRTLANSMNSFGNVSGNSVGVAEFASSIGKLGGANVQRAITNLPALATAMNNFMATMANAPHVSNNIIQMTRAMADLAAQGSKVGTVSNSLTKNVNKVGNAMGANTKKAKGFVSVIGSLYQKFFWVSRGADELWDSIEKSMGYVENLNYFNAALGQVAEAAVAQWEKAGYDSANAYYESFSDRAKELTSKMTGFNVNDDGTLTATGEASLGINPSKLMNYQAMFAQMSSSMGVASETSLLLSQALTEIGADLASVKNMDFDKVWTDMASGLAGMSRTLDKYGVNIRNVNLQQKLFELGINENITNLNQNDKALLRTIILLDSTKYAWGDLADTINQPANQMRLLESNIDNLSRTLGNLFLPILAKALPLINGLVIATERLLTWLGSLIGIDLGDITSAVGSSEVDMSELLGETEELTGGLNDAAKAADKLKKGIRGFDELNVITTQDDSGSGGAVGAGLASGLLDKAFVNAFSEYQKTWDEAFANMENRANDFADKVESYFQPIKDIINDFVVGDFFKAGQDTSNLVASIFDFFSRSIDDVDWNELGNDIGEYLEGIEWTKVFNSVGNFIETGVEAAIDLWKGAFDAAPIETSIISGLALLKFTGVGSLLWNKISSSFSATALGKSIGFTPTVAIAAVTWVIGFDVGKSLGKALFPEDAKFYEEFTWFGEEGFFDQIFGSDFETHFDAITNMSREFGGLLGIFDALKEKIYGTSLEFEDLFFGLDDLIDLSSVWFEVWFNNHVAPWLSKERWQKLGNNAKMALTEEWNEFTSWWETTGVYKWYKNDVEPFFSKEKWSWSGIKDGLSETWNAAIEAIKDKWNDFAGWLNDKLTINIDTSSIIGKGISEVLGSTEISFGMISTFATGGFPEDGWFRASKGEYFGSFDDGTSVIANNEQIISGIANGVRDANAEQIALLREQNYLLQKILEKETGISSGDIFRSVRKEANDYFERTGNPAFS